MVTGFSRIHGPFLFGVTDKISAVTENLHTLPRVVILGLRTMTALDATGLKPSQLIRQAQFAVVVGEENIGENVLEALRAEEVYEGRAEFETRESDSAILQR